MSKTKSTGAPEAGAPDTTQDEKEIAAPLAGAPDTFQADGKEYKFIAGRFILDGKEITAEEALQDEQILATLVDMKAGVIAEVKAQEVSNA